MPLAQLYIGPGRSDAQKKTLIENVTKAMKDALGPLQQPVWVIINEVPVRAPNIMKHVCVAVQNW